MRICRWRTEQSKTSASVTDFPACVRNRFCCRTADHRAAGPEARGELDTLQKTINPGFSNEAGNFVAFSAAGSASVPGDGSRERSVSAQLVCPALCFSLRTEQMHVFHIDHPVTGADCHVCKYAVSRDLFSGERTVIDTVNYNFPFFFNRCIYSMEHSRWHHHLSTAICGIHRYYCAQTLILFINFLQFLLIFPCVIK